MRRVAVSAAGVYSPLGNGVTELWERARAGRSGVHRLDLPFASRLVSPIAATVDLDGTVDVDPVQLRMMDRFAVLALLAARQAVASSSGALADLSPERGGVFIGTGMGGTLTMDDGYQTLYGERSDRIKPFTVLAGMHNAAAAWIGIEHGLQGPNLTYSNRLFVGRRGHREAWLRVASGQLDVVLAGGAEAPLSPGSLKAWEALHTVARVQADDPATSCRRSRKTAAAWCWARARRCSCSSLGIGPWRAVPMFGRGHRLRGVQRRHSHHATGPGRPGGSNARGHDGGRH
jgi:3-oxoacyl-[acyl-carrier-protein] synthase II